MNSLLLQWSSINKNDRKKFPLRDELKASQIPIIFLPEIVSIHLLAELQQIFNKLKIVAVKKGFVDKDRFNRACWEDESSISKLQLKMLQVAERYFKVKLEPTYHYLAMYLKDSDCPIHTDREECEYTIAINIQQNGIWPLYVEGKEYLLNPGNALLYSGKHHIHWREASEYPGRLDMLLLFYREATQ
ncbi:MAG: hypothetical protein VYA54_06795 [Bdellovibrionota bacterium]|nr:hypothetical protein [Bdellovibrionota bacterium]